MSNFKIFRMNQSPQDGVYINGLFIEGARWSISDNSLEEQHPKIVINKVPAIHMIVRCKRLFDVEFNFN